MKITVLLLILALAVAASADKGKSGASDYKVFRLSSRQLAVVCLDGADPTIYPKLTGQDALVISCGK
jgi:hypothetical protein